MTAQSARLRLVREGRDLIVLGPLLADLVTDLAAAGEHRPQLLEIRDALDAFGISNAAGWRWDASMTALACGRDGRWDISSASDISISADGVASVFVSPLPKDARTAVVLAGFTDVAGSPVTDEDVTALSLSAHPVIVAGDPRRGNDTMFAEILDAFAA